MIAFTITQITNNPATKPAKPLASAEGINARRITFP
jgi:hypothetical protein